MTNKSPNLERNFHAIAAILRDCNLSKVVSTFNGFGDSGEIYAAEVFREDAPGEMPLEDLPDVNYQELTFQHIPGEGYQDVFKNFITSAFVEAVRDVTEQALTIAGHAGWENNAGSDGALTIYANGHAVLEIESHYDENEEDDDDSETFVYSWNDLTEAPSRTQ